MGASASMTAEDCITSHQEVMRLIISLGEWRRNLGRVLHVLWLLVLTGFGLPWLLMRISDAIFPFPPR
jgi:hypothetical protein